jgi:hypothetical protein
LYVGIVSDKEKKFYEIASRASRTKSSRTALRHWPRVTPKTRSSVTDPPEKISDAKKTFKNCIFLKENLPSSEGVGLRKTFLLLEFIFLVFSS